LYLTSEQINKYHAKLFILKKKQNTYAPKKQFQCCAKLYERKFDTSITGYLPFKARVRGNATVRRSSLSILPVMCDAPKPIQGEFIP
jgi:hypothetical protein